MGIVFAAVGYRRIVYAVFGPSDLVTCIAAIVALAGAAVGPWVARRAADMALRAWRTVAVPALRGRGDVVGGAVDGDDAAPMVPWLVQAMLGIGSGVLLLVGLAASAGVARLWDYVEARFYWTPVSEIVCIAALVALFVAPVAVAVGLHCASLYAAAGWLGGVTRPASGARRRPAARARDPGKASRQRVGSRSLRARPAAPAPSGRAVANVSSWLLVGAAAATIVVDRAGLHVGAGQWVLLSAVCMFAASVTALWVTRRLEHARVRPLRPHEAEGPEWSWRSRGMILGAVAAWGAAASMLGATWATTWSGVPDAGSLAYGLAFGAVGAWSAAQRVASRRFSMGGFGMALCAAGAGILLGVVLRGDEVGGAAQHVAWLAAAVCVGHALPYGRRALVGRAASEAQGLARWTAALACGLALGAAAQLVVREAGLTDAGVQAAACLLLLVFGGLLQIHETHATRRLRQRRLGAAFVLLGLATLLLPPAARRVAAQARRQDDTIADSESSGSTLTASGLDFTREAGVPRELLAAAPVLGAPGAAMAVIGGAWGGAGPMQRIERIPWSCDVEDDATGRATTEAEHAGWWASADSWWRNSRGEYDAIVQLAPRHGGDDYARYLTAEWLNGLHRRVVPTGVLLVQLPVDRLDVAGVLSVLHTMQAACDEARCSLVIGGGASPRCVFALISTPEPVGEAESPVVDGSDARVKVVPVAVTWVAGHGARIHTLRAPSVRLSRRVGETASIMATVLDILRGPRDRDAAHSARRADDRRAGSRRARRNGHAMPAAAPREDRRTVSALRHMPPRRARA